jgi:hypothetical protein
MAKKQRDISVSEFFAKNRHLLGFDNPSKALLTTVKEGVDNSLDACEEAGILPNVVVEIRQVSETRFRVANRSSTACARAGASRASASAPRGCTGSSPRASPSSSRRARARRRRRTTSSSSSIPSGTSRR